MVFSSPVEFANYIEMRVQRENKRYLDILVEMIESEDVDVESIQDLMSQPLKDRLEVDFQEDGYLRRPSNTLSSFLS